MRRCTVGKYSYLNFGSSNYSCGMEAVVFDAREISAKEVLKLPGFWLHPTCEPNECEIFSLKGTAEQFKRFFTSAVEGYATRTAVRQYGLDYTYPEVNEARKMLIEYLTRSFVPWYSKL